MAKHEKGYTLAELIVVILIFSIVMMLISVSFNRIIASSAQIMKSAETDIGGSSGSSFCAATWNSPVSGSPGPWAARPTARRVQASCLTAARTAVPARMHCSSTTPPTKRRGRSPSATTWA